MLVESVARVEVIVVVPSEVTVGATRTVGAVEVTVTVVEVGQARMLVRGWSGGCASASSTARLGAGVTL